MPTHHAHFATHHQARVDHVGGRPVVVCRGDLDLAAVDDVWRCIEQARHSSRPLVIDLSEVSFMDSAAAALLLRAYRLQGRLRESVVLKHPSPAAMRVLSMTNLPDLLDIEHDPATAARWAVQEVHA
ncbi:MAG TPA: STAS domain-containing protein [Acidimicrobiales bacterium]|nr:STAS domain-containing protein [Acidimicrobiales bacterium]